MSDRTTKVAWALGVLGLGLMLQGAGCGGGDDGPDASVDDAGGDGDTDGDTDTDTTPQCPPDHEDDEPYESPDCADGPAAGQTDRLAEALGLVGLTRDTFGWTNDDWNEADYLPYLFDDFALSEFRPNHDAPVQSACWAADVTARIDHAFESSHPLSRQIAHAAARLDHPVDETEPTYQHECEDNPLAVPLYDLVVALGGAQTQTEVTTAVTPIPVEYQLALAPIVMALTEAVEARAAAFDALGKDTAFAIALRLSSLIYFSGGSAFDLGDPALVGDLDGPWLDDLYQAAYRLAVTIDHGRNDLETLSREQFKGATGFDVDFDTPGGRVMIQDGGDHVYEWPDSDRTSIALLVDTGGDDVYRVPVGGTTFLEQPVALALDLAGSDEYGYEALEDPNANVGNRIPMDSERRYAPSDTYGPFSLSTVCRQGGARFGIAILEDLGGSDDSYRTLRLGQGFAAAGVGVLHDDAGDDEYTGEAGVQGSAMFGIGLLLDDGGADHYAAYSMSQGFGYTRGAGWLVDSDGTDEYLCDNGNPDTDGDPLYYSPQRPGTGNTSLCQGAGDGLRGDGLEPPTFWSGGLGVLRDRRGGDRYEASVFAQATGYWSGIGLLSDGSGNDKYDAIWYAQAGAAHYATAILVDSDGDDAYNENEWIVGVGVGTGHDYSLGMLIDEAGNDRYFASGNGAGSGNCNGIGILVDNEGDDIHRANSTTSYGHAHVSGECERRSGAVTAAVFVDVGGDDTYERDGETLTLDDGVSWTQRGTYESAPEGYESERGVGFDTADGDSTLHAPASTD